ncbi:hypothetical protein DFS34DRAFT_647416 [Phlyctochytrium arcticum]|nr:hypothetical protein DFS34DRAFT_647416 [Phlyctochytrium arcticum]
MAEEKRMEKLLKRAKPFLDEKLKAKQRLSSLWNFLDNTSEPDQCKFFQDHDFQVFNVFHECFSHQVDKIKAREKPDKLLSVNSKEVVDLMRVLQILRKVFVFLPERMRYGWQRKSIVGVLQTLLCTANHPKVRIEGFRLLLLYLNSHSSESAEVIPLYSNAFLLSVFDAFPFPLPANLANHDCEDPPIVGLDSRAEDLLGLGDDVMSPQGSYVAAEGMSSSRADTSNILLKDEWKGEGKGKLNQSSIEWERKVQTLTGATSSSGGGTTYKTHLLPSPTPFTTYDAVDLLEELLQNMVMAASGDIPATTTLPVASIASQYGSMLRIGGMGGGAISRHSSFAEMRAGSDSKADSVVGSTTAQPSTGIGLGITMSNTGVDEAPPAIPSPVGNRETELPVTHPGPGTGCLGADGLDAREKRLKFMWEIFQKYYLRLLFPKVSRKSGLQVADGEGFATCPPQLLHSLINFLIRQCLDPSAPTTSATALRNLLLNPNSPNCDMVHEWLRQAMLLPYMWSDVTRGAIAVIRAWCSVSNEARPAFLRAPTPLPDTSDEDDFLKDHEFEQGETNSYLRRYIRCMRLTFLQKSDSVEYINAQMTIFAEVLSLYRFIILDVSELHVSRQTRQTLTSTLLDITSQVLCQTDPCAVVPYPARAAEIADLLFETIFYTWVRCRMKDNKLWETLRKVLKECTRWKECIGQWGTVVLKLTNVMCKYVYQSDIDLNASCGQIPCSATDISRIIAANSTSASSNTTTVPNLAAIPHLKSVASVASAATTFSKIRDRSQSIYLASGVNVNPSGPSTSGSSTPTSTLVDRHERSSFLVPSTHSGSVASSMVRALSPQTRQKGDSNGMVSARSDPDLTAHTYSVEKDKAGTAMKGRDSEYRMGSNTVTEESTEDTRIETLPAPFLKDLHPTSTVSIQIDALENPSRIPILAVQHSVTMPEFVDLESLSFWDAENALFLWKNMVCVLGNVNEIEVPANHAAAMTFLLNVWDRLEKTRDSQPYASDSQQMPSLFEFAVWFFQAADMNEYIFRLKTPQSAPN